VLSSRGGDDDDGGSKKSQKDLEKEAPFCSPKSPKHPDEKVSPRARALQDQGSHRFGVMINT
jgi:hypothetical protein